MNRKRTLSDNENANNNDEVVSLQLRPPRITYERVNYVELYDEQDFINTFHVSKMTFTTVLRLIKNEISPPSTMSTKEILAPSKLYMMLKYFATGSFQSSVSDFPDIGETKACHYVLQACKAVAKLKSKYILFPTNDIDAKRVTQGFYNRGGFSGVIGVIGSTHIKIQFPGRDKAESYRNLDGYFSINAQIICNPWLKIMDLVAHWPGSSQSQIIFENSDIKRCLKLGIMKGRLLGDSSYTAKHYLKTPVSSPVSTPVSQNEMLHNKNHLHTNRIIERCFNVLKRRFPVLTKGITVDTVNAQSIIVACAILHNISVDMHDDLPNGKPVDDNINNNGREDHLLSLPGIMTSGEQDKDGVVTGHVTSLQKS